MLFVAFCIFYLFAQPGHAAPSSDFDGNGQVGFADFLLFTQHFGVSKNSPKFSATFDLDGDGEIGFADFLIFSSQFGQTVTLPNILPGAPIAGATGGVVALENGPEIRIPAGALSQNGAIFIKTTSLPEEQQPQDAVRIGEIYDIQLDSATLVAPIHIAIPYNPSALPAEATLETVYAAWWDGENWRPVSGRVDERFIHITVNHLSIWTTIFSRLPVIKQVAHPDSVLLIPGQSSQMVLNLAVDPSGLPLGDLRVRLSAQLSDSVSATSLGKITLFDNGLPDQPVATVAGLIMNSADTTAPLDGRYSAAFTFDPDLFPVQFSVLRLDLAITTRRIASIAIDTTLVVPIVRAPAVVHAISGRLLRTGKGVADAVVVLSGPTIATDSTDAEGRYSFANLKNGTYVVTPFKSGYVFTPQSQTLALLGEDINGVDFFDLTDGASYAGGPALFLDGNGFLAIDIPSDHPLNLATDSLTVEAWIYPEDNISRTIAGRWQGNSFNPSGQWFLGTHSVGVGTQNATFSAPLSVKLQPQTWHHYGMVIKNGRVQTYVNGRQALDTLTTITPPLATEFASNHLIVGGFQNGLGKTPDPFKGQIDELRIWNRALSATEIRQNMHHSFKPVFSRLALNKQAAPPNIIGYWNFDTPNRNGSIPDLSGQNASGILSGSATRTDGNAPLALSVGNPILQITPLSFNLTGPSATRDITIRNVGSGQLVWTLGEQVTYLHLSSQLGHTGGSGRFYGSGPLTITMQATGIGLPFGTYETTIQIWSNGGSFEIPVTFGLDSLSSAITATIDTLFTPAGTYHEMIRIPAGEFAMGSVAGESDAQPVHSVYLDDYRMDRYEVTHAQYEAFTVATVRLPWSLRNDFRYNAPSQPVVGVSWNDARAYCTWMGGRLPTEAEWEKAARGLSDRTYPWGETPPDSALLNFNRHIGKSVAVGTYPKGISPYGVFDLSGNVWEWTSDWYHNTYYASSPDQNPQGSDRGSVRVARGGSWGESAIFVRTFNRFFFSPTATNELIGFRCVTKP